MRFQSRVFGGKPPTRPQVADREMEPLTIGNAFQELPDKAVTSGLRAISATRNAAARKEIFSGAISTRRVQRI